MLVLILSLIVVFCLPTEALLCYKDTQLHDVQEYSYKLPYAPFDDYWNKQRIDYDKPKNKVPVKHNLNLAFNLFGRFSGNTDDAFIRAGYYGKDKELIYSVEVSCADNSWKSFAPSPADPKIGALYQEGHLEKSCIDGEDFDLIFKVKQAHQFVWLFNAEPLQKGIQVTHFGKSVGGKFVKKARNRTLNVPSPDESPKGGAAKAVEFTIETSGAAVLTRFAFGRCMAWPQNLPCNETKIWLGERSKGRIYNGPLGAHRAQFGVYCMPGVDQLYAPTQLLHPDEHSIPQSGWVCCFNMKTGEIWENDRGKYCRQLADWATQGMPFFCQPAYDEKLVEEETDKLGQAVDEKLIEPEETDKLDQAV